MKLHISDDLKLPLEAVTETFAVLARKGSGKTYLASVLAEEMLKSGQQIVAIDPTGGFWGLQSSADGQHPGFPILVLGGEHGNLPLEEHAGEVIATAITEGRLSAVLDLSLFRKGQVIRFMVGFAEALYRLNREAMHLFVDEADALAPQGRSFGGDENRMLGAMEDIVRRGRKRGIGCTLITQRPAVLNKSVLTQAGSLFCLRMGHPRDIKAIEEWVNVHAEPDDAKTVIASLPSLPIGNAWFWSPGWMGTLKRIVIRQRETFDSSATPRPGEAQRVPKKLAEIDLDMLGAQIRDAAQRAKDNDPRELKRRIVELEKPAAAKVRTERVEVPVLDKEQLHLLKNSVDRLTSMTELFGDMGQTLKEVGDGIAVSLTRFQGRQQQQDASVTPKPTLRPTVSIPRAESTNGDGGHESVGQGGLRRILIALAQRNGLSARQIGVRAGLSSSSGTFGTYLAKARSARWIEGGRDRVMITELGLSALGPYDPLPTGQALLAYWLNELGDSGAARILQVVAESYPQSLTKEETGERAGLSTSSGTFGTYLSKLRTLELIEGRGELRASDDLFD